MFCRYCGRKMEDDSLICPGCGYRRETPPAFTKEETKPKHAANSGESVVKMLTEKEHLAAREDEPVKEEHLAAKEDESIKEEEHLAAGEDGPVKEDSAETEECYIILPGLQGKLRKKVSTVISCIFCLFGLFCLSKIGDHVLEEFHAAEGYIFIVYVARFVDTCAPYLAYIATLGVLAELFTLKKKNAEAGKLSKLVIGLQLSGTVLFILSGYLFASDSNIKNMHISVALLENSYLEYILALKDAIFVLIIAKVLFHISDKIMEKDGLETEEWLSDKETGGD